MNYFRDLAVVLVDGTVFRGRGILHRRSQAAEVVFNTSMVGYQELIGDPSYAGQLLVLTTAMVGNCGVAHNDMESAGIYLQGLIVNQMTRPSQHYRKDMSLMYWLEQHRIAWIEQVDTRALVRHLTKHGSMLGLIEAWPQSGQVAASLQQAAQTPMAWGQTYKLKQPYTATLTDNFKIMPEYLELGAGLHVVVLDFGVKFGILRQLLGLGCRVTVVPGDSDVATLTGLAPNGILLSNGPGDPAYFSSVVKQLPQLLQQWPTMGICLGFQLMALAMGGKSFKLAFGHRGANHPVLCLNDAGQRVELTTQNHGYAIAPDSLDPQRVTLTHRNLHDGTLEGIALNEYPAFGVQYHPEASPGPTDAHGLFVQFVARMRQGV